jgi:RNA polymerase sigma-70 factor (ECF subfamily)
MFFRSSRKSDDAFVEEALAHADALHGVARRMCRDAALAEDLVQETMLKALTSREQFTPGTNLRSWLFRILTNVWVSRYRRAGLERATFEAPEVDPISDGWVSAETMRHLRDPEDLAVAPLLRAELERALDLLPEDFRMAVLLVDAQDLSYEEAATALQVPPGTIMSRLHRGRKMLQKVLVEQGRALGLAKAEALAEAVAAAEAEASPTSLDAFREKKLRGAR